MAHFRPKQLAHIEPKWVAQLRPFYPGVDDETKGKLTYTNPVNETFRINQAGNLEIYSLTGVKVVEKTIESNQAVDVSHLAKGIYIFELNGNVKGKIVKR